ncbi:MAG: hypothetical protein LBM02_02640 [Lachnospiraceae bacterium]|jgi:type IV secretory pathway VirB3-like protein|nr:hypothetical protein [Lachnospiraceae bacterium]
MDLDMIFGVSFIACSLVFFYAYVKLKFKKEVTPWLYLPKDGDPKKIKNIEAFIDTMANPTLILGIVLLLYGVLNILIIYIKIESKWFYVALVLIMLGVFWFFRMDKQATSLYYGDDFDKRGRKRK